MTRAGKDHQRSSGNLAKCSGFSDRIAAHAGETRGGGLYSHEDLDACAADVGRIAKISAASAYKHVAGCRKSEMTVYSYSKRQFMTG